MRISILAAVSANGVIGRRHELPWRLPADLKRFKRLTRDRHLIMGRKTFESIGRLPGRASVVLTRNELYRAEGVLIVHDLDEAIRQISGDDEAFVIGGGEIYQLALPRVARLYMTAVHAEVEGDIFFPQVDWDEWELLEDVRFEADAENRYDYSFRLYDRVRKGIGDRG